MTMMKILLAIAWTLVVATTAPVARAEVLPGVEPAPADLQAIERRRVEGQAQETHARLKMREVLALPDFSTDQTMWVPALKKRVAVESPEWMTYVERFGRFLAGVLRAGVWIFGAIAVVVLLVTLHRWWRMTGKRMRAGEVSIPTHVGTLDIRAESLPDDIGAAARARWQAGDITGSLSLLYRGALSALVLRYEAPIRSSYTEAECRRAARARLNADGYTYFESLTGAWLLAVYAGRRPDDVAGLALCDGFAVHFPAGRNPAASVDITPQGRSASRAAA